MTNIIASLKRGLIVSCQAIGDNPLCGTGTMPLMALCAARGGASGIRANGAKDIQEIKRLVDIPVIGICKTAPSPDSVYITPDFESARLVSEAGADIIALDATSRPRPGGIRLQDLVHRIKNELGRPVMADVSVFEEGISAAEFGCDIVATTLSGYTQYSRKTHDPDFDLLKRLASELDVPVIAEGRLWTHEHVLRSFELGAFAVVVGKAITNPMIITRKFIEACSIGI